ncbi:MAG: hypothetical protein D6818_09660 [Bacteroidetes bacterium]|nr:MAG: hypothetical protein D6818_09660 [Bacteroidota bacterium]
MKTNHPHKGTPSDQAARMPAWLFDLAREYDRVGDVYHAVKLCKRVVKQVPSWAEPFAFLAEIYLRRREWKPALYYALATLQRQADHARAREIGSLAAMAQRQWVLARRLAGGVHLDWHRPAVRLVCLNPGLRPEVLTARTRTIGQTVIEGVPQPSSGYRYGDVVLTGWSPIAMQVSRGRRIEVLPVWKCLFRSRFLTYSVVLATSAAEHIEAMRQLCRHEGIGFDNWSMAVRQMAPRDGSRPAELYDHTIFGQAPSRGHTLVALASPRKGKVWRALQHWHILTGAEYYGLTRHE